MFATAARRLAPALAAEARLLDGGCGGTSNLLAQPLLSLRAWAEARARAPISDISEATLAVFSTVVMSAPVMLETGITGRRLVR